MIKLLSKFKYRSTEDEILDKPGISPSLLAKNFAEMDFVNHHLGGTFYTLNALDSIIKDRNQHYSILDVGCGSGDMLIKISKWLQRKGVKASLTGIDINPEAIQIAKKQQSEIAFLNLSYENISDSYDIIISSLFCHHLQEGQFVDFLKFSKEKSRIGFVINDLIRHPVPYYFIWLFSRLFNGTALLKNDAPLSVLRGFKKAELLKSLGEAKIETFSIKRNWAFRYLITSKNSNDQ